MNINKKLDRVKQWTGEKMGRESKTGMSDEFKQLEGEMALRHDGMEKLQKSATVYIKSLSKRNEAEDKEKVLPVAYLGQTMMHHGEDFDTDSEFGNCLISMGRTNDRISRLQESYVANATSSWLESLERSLVMMKEYQAARKKLETRRLAYDASLSKMQKAKREDFRVEEELRSQKAKYEESSEDVLRRMEDIKEAEADSISDLGSFLDAELEYYDRCREELLRLKRDWPGANGTRRDNKRPTPRSRSNTARSFNDRQDLYEETRPDIPIRPTIRSQGSAPSAGRLNTRLEQLNTDDDFLDSPLQPPRPNYSRSSTFQGPTSMNRESPISATSSRNGDFSAIRGQLRPPGRINTSGDVFGDPSDDSTLDSASPDHSYRTRSVSPATSHGSAGSRGALNGRKAPPPPPPSRATKPAPPVPMKRANMSASTVTRY